MEYNNIKTRKARSKGFIGIIIVTIGLLFLFKNLGMIDNTYLDYIFSWPSILIVLGLAGIFSHAKHKLFPIILLLTGSFFMLDRIIGLSLSFGQIIWPAVIIFIGLAILFSRGRHKWDFDKSRQTNQDRLDEVNVFSGSRLIINSSNFKGGDFVGVFGGSEIDLRQAKLGEGENVIDVTMVFGGFSMLVPPEWNIVTDVTGILGGFSDSRITVPEDQIDKSRTLYIKGIAVFGGGELKTSD
jgi:predicted membrane protein